MNQHSPEPSKQIRQKFELITITYTHHTNTHHNIIWYVSLMLKYINFEPKSKIFSHLHDNVFTMSESPIFSFYFQTKKK